MSPPVPHAGDSDALARRPLPVILQVHPGAQMPPDELADKLEIQDLICSVCVGSDLRDMDNYRDFTPDATMDYSSAWGRPGSVSLADFKAAVMQFRPGFDATQHQVSNFDIQINGDTATCRSVVYAMQRVDDALGWNAGIYHHTLVRTPAGWRIRHLRYQLQFKDDPDNLGERARQKVQNAS
jgi:hypothetical protein